MSGTSADGVDAALVDWPDDPARARFGYTKMTGEDEWADKCVECGKCEPLCPQHIDIIDKLKEAHAALTTEDA